MTCLSDYHWMDLMECMIHLGRYQDLINLMCTCQRLSQLGQPLINQEARRLSERPSEYYVTRFISHCVEHQKKWFDAKHCPHRLGDQPAIITIHAPIEYAYGWREVFDLLIEQRSVQDHDVSLTYQWYQHGELHRDHDQPALLSSNSQEWYQHGLLHREDNQPAIILTDGTKEWYYRNGIRYDPSK